MNYCLDLLFKNNKNSQICDKFQDRSLPFYVEVVKVCSLKDMKISFVGHCIKQHDNIE